MQAFDSQDNHDVKAINKILINPPNTILKKQLN